MNDAASASPVPTEATARPGQLYYRHRLPVRVMHWINVVALTILFMSGLNIFEAHPALYWGASSYTGRPPILEIGAREREGGPAMGYTRVFGHEFNTTGVLGVHRTAEGISTDAFPGWLTIPSGRWLSMARAWHFFFAWVFLINGLVYLVYTIVSRHLARDLWPTREDIRGIGASIREHLRFKHPSGEAAKRYNVLQKLTYLVVIFVLLPLVILMGAAMSPRLDTVLTGWVNLFGGRQSARTIHFIVAWLIVAFAAVHVFEVIITGLWNNLRSMITGRYRVPQEAAHE
ncbi:MAG TPA: cytochrome b/b6 domain-containing protein [Casimicrobiaceae bacterium]|nr:cytochrome b/b6 domain-containing protein [Casimicrobiaceae bacterium]